MNNPSEKEITDFSEKLNHLWREQRMNEAKMLLLTEVEKYPNEYFFVDKSIADLFKIRRICFGSCIL